MTNSDSCNELPSAIRGMVALQQKHQAVFRAAFWLLALFLSSMGLNLYLLATRGRC